MDLVGQQNAEFYRDLPLDIYPQAIRLLCTLPGAKNEEVTCILERAPLEIFKRPLRRKSAVMKVTHDRPESDYHDSEEDEQVGFPQDQNDSEDHVEDKSRGSRMQTPETSTSMESTLQQDWKRTCQQMRQLHELHDRDAKQVPQGWCSPVRYFWLLTRKGYKALSYTWGTRTAGHTITVNGRPGFAVTDNLAAALIRLRKQGRPRWFWIDAICIDQNATSERSSQVRMMGDIYSFAARVFVWLGEPDIQCDIPVTDKQARNVSDDEPLFEPVNLPLLLLADAVTKTAPQWWTRVWTVQEYIKAERQPMMLYGSAQTSWSMTLSMAFDQSKPVAPFRWPDMSHEYSLSLSDLAGAMLQLQAYDVEYIAQLGLVGTLKLMSTLRCEDPRDKVYGFLSLVSAPEREVVQPDYQQPCWQAYSTATYATICTYGDLRGLNIASLGFSKEVDGLPTWAINFSRRTTRLRFLDLIPGSPLDNMPFGRGANGHGDPWLHTRNSREQSVATPSLSQDARHLIVDGYFVDTVLSVTVLSSDNPIKIDDSERVASLRNMYRRLRSFRSPSTYPMSRYRFNKIPGWSAIWILYFVVPKACKAGEHTEGCMKYHISIDTKLDLKGIKRGPPADKISSRRLIHLFEKMCSSFNPYEYPMQIRSLLDHSWAYVRLNTDVHGCTLFTTKKGFIGLATIDVAVGDTIGLFHLHRLPCALRPSDDGTYSFQGFVSVETPASGDLGTFHGNDSFETQTFVLC